MNGRQNAATLDNVTRPDCPDLHIARDADLVGNVETTCAAHFITTGGERAHSGHEGTASISVGAAPVVRFSMVDVVNAIALVDAQQRFVDDRRWGRA